jgi:hypothetical protein
VEGWGCSSMSIEAGVSTADQPDLSLREYIEALVLELGRADAPAVERMRRVVGTRGARITLDSETVDVWFGPRGLVVEDVTPGRQVDGEGATDRATVGALLDGGLEVTDAIMTGRLQVAGVADAVVRMFTAIEILLDGSARVPAMQDLARRFRGTGGTGAEPRPGPRTSPWVGRAPSSPQMELLGRLGLLPDRPGPPATGRSSLD